MAALASVRLAPGALVAQRYELTRHLGEGGMGVVWAATHTVTQKRVALKFLKGPASEELVQRFAREARAVSAVRHPNVIEIHDILALDDGLPVMVMDLLEGESLAEKLLRSGALSWQELSRIMLPVMCGVSAAHAAGVVHRDLKPDNIFLSLLGDGQVQPTVFDFGICKLDALAGSLERAALTQTGFMMGTPAYMAPEQVYADKDVDARADVWALGIILYECATGQRPVTGRSVGQMLKLIASGAITPIEQIAPQLPAQLSKLVGRMLARDRNARPTDLREPIATLRELLANAPGPTQVSVQLRVDLPPAQLRSDASVGGSKRHSVRAPSRAAVALTMTTLVALGFVTGMRLLRGRAEPVPEAAQASAAQRLAARSVEPPPAQPTLPVVGRPSALAQGDAAPEVPSRRPAPAWAAAIQRIGAGPNAKPKPVLLALASGIQGFDSGRK